MSYFVRGATDTRTVSARVAHVPVDEVVGFDVYLVIGSEDAFDQRAAALDDPGDARVLVWNHRHNQPLSRYFPGESLLWNFNNFNFAGVGAVAYSFATACAEILPPNRRVMLCQCGAYGRRDFEQSSNIIRALPPGGEGSDAPLITMNTWQPVPDGPGFSLLDFAIRQANRAMAYHPVSTPSPAPGTPASPFNRFKGVLWLNASSVAGWGYDEAYVKAVLQGIVSRVRAEIDGAADAPFLCGQPPASYTWMDPEDGVARVYPRVGDLAYFGLPRCAAVSTLAPTPIEDDGYSLTARGMYAYGKRFFTTLQRLTAEYVPTADNAVALVDPDSDGPVANVTWWPSEDVEVTQVRWDGNVAMLLANSAVRLSNLAPRALVTLTPRSARGVVGDPVTVAVQDTPWWHRTLAAAP